jgi:uncharacterized protein YdhG (YjbR/CyaY superfamily)
MKKQTPATITDYIEAQPEVVGSKLKQVRSAIQKAVPDAIEVIGYGMPGYKFMGKPMLYFAGFKQHYSLFAASGSFFALLKDELQEFDQRKGTIHFPLDKPVPVRLIGRIAKLRANGIAEAINDQKGNDVKAERQRPASGSVKRRSSRTSK